MARSPAEIQADIALTRRVIETQLDAISRKVPRAWWTPWAFGAGALVVGLVLSRLPVLKVVGLGGVPASGVVDVALSVVSVDSTAASSFTVFPHGGPRPASPQLSWVKAQRVNNLVWVRVGSGGAVDVTNATGTSHLVVDVEGYYTSASGSGDVVAAVNGTKLFDSRPTKSPVPANGVQTVQVTGHAGVPSGATAALVQLTAVRPGQRDYVRAWAAGAARPKSYALYAPKGAMTSATAVVPLSSSGALSISPLFATHLVVTIEGWFIPAPSPPTTGVTSLVTPAKRLVRLSLAAGATKTVALSKPSGMDSALITISASGQAGSYVSVWPAGQRTPPVATLSLGSGWVRTSRLTPLGTNNSLSIHNAGRATIQILVDLCGWA